MNFLEPDNYIVPDLSVHKLVSTMNGLIYYVHTMLIVDQLLPTLNDYLRRFFSDPVYSCLYMTGYQNWHDTGIDHAEIVRAIHGQIRVDHPM